MLNSPFDNDKSILERLKHPEMEARIRKAGMNLFIRNIQNSLFILLAIIAMDGIGLYAVLIKMVEVVMRMPGLNK